MIPYRALSLVRATLNETLVDSAKFLNFFDKDWHKLIQFANQQSIIGLCFDVIEKFKGHGLLPQRNLRMQWIGNVMVLEKVYNKQKVIIKKLSTHFSDYGLKMVLMKGYGLSRLYPIPAHRGVGDLDVYFCGKGQYADELIKAKGIEVKQNEEKHSVYDYDGVHVENHASIICEQEQSFLIKG